VLIDYKNQYKVYIFKKNYTSYCNYTILSKQRHVKSILECIEVFSKVSKLIAAAFQRWFSRCANFVNGVSK